MAAKLFLCDCAKSQELDRDAIEAACGMACSRVHSNLCTTQIEAVAEAMEAGDDLLIACQQERPVFEALADELGKPEPVFVDIRDRAGWSDEGGKAAPKMAALIADACLEITATKTYDVTSHGLCLILGPAETAIPAAEKLSSLLSVTVLLTEADAMLPKPVRAFDVLSGAVKSVSGALGSFSLSIDQLRQSRPGGRGELGFDDPRDGARTECDILLDLRGATPLFPAHHKREGYLRPDPGDPLAVADALREASHLIGTFEKPLYISFDESLCAHSRAGQTACTNCLELCPTGAITPAGDHVEIDADVCAGCGACAAACPSGAATYGDPAPSDLFKRVRTYADVYRTASGATAPVLLVHDAAHGREMISLGARLGRGLPAHCLPLELSSPGSFGHAEALVALASGFASVQILAWPGLEADAMAAQVALANAIDGAERVAVLDVADPDALSDALYDLDCHPRETEAILPLGGRRDATRLAAKALRADVDAPISLPEGAPYGAVLVNRDSCTLCLACASLCPTGALGDDPDMPKLTFKEDACLQCGLCATVCPEDAIAYEPQLNLADSALREAVLNEEEPYPCIECGRPFGVRSTIERIVEKLEGQHAMFTNSDNAKLIRMCDDCRIQAQYHSDAQPFAAKPRPKPRTTEDYLRDRDKT